MTLRRLSWVARRWLGNIRAEFLQRYPQPLMIAQRGIAGYALGAAVTKHRSAQAHPGQFAKGLERELVFRAVGFQCVHESSCIEIETNVKATCSDIEIDHTDEDGRG